MVVEQVDIKVICKEDKALLTKSLFVGHKGAMTRGLVPWIGQQVKG